MGSDSYHLCRRMRQAMLQIKLLPFKDLWIKNASMREKPGKT